MLSHVSVNTFYHVSLFYAQTRVFELLDKLQTSSNIYICEQYITRCNIIKVIRIAADMGISCRFIKNVQCLWNFGGSRLNFLIWDE